MKKTTNFLLLILFVFSVGLTTSCKKDEEKPKSKEELLTGKKWQVKTAIIDPSIPVSAGGTTTNLYNQIEPCFKDDYSVFNANGTFIDDAGGVKCDVGDAQTTSGTWLFNGDKTIVTLNYPASGGDAAFSMSFKILELSDSKLMYEIQDDYLNNGTIYTITFTMQPI